MVSESMVMFTACYADPTPGGTKATVVFESERLPGGAFFGRFAAPFVARTVRRNYRSDLAQLKTILEQGEANTA